MANDHRAVVSPVEASEAVSNCTGAGVIRLLVHSYETITGCFISFFQPADLSELVGPVSFPGRRADYRPDINPGLELLINSSETYRREVVSLHKATVRVLDSQSELSTKITDTCTLVSYALGCMESCLAKLETVSRNTASIRSLESTISELQQCLRELVKHFVEVASQEQERIAGIERLIEDRMDRALAEREGRLNELFLEKERMLQQQFKDHLASITEFPVIKRPRTRSISS